MEDKDILKEILKGIDGVYENVDLESIILNSIQEQEKSKIRIYRYKDKGVKSLIVSVILIVILGILFSLSIKMSTVENSIVTYTSIILILIVFFIQIEMGGNKIFNNLKNNL